MYHRFHRLMNSRALGYLALVILSLHATADELVIQKHRSIPLADEPLRGNDSSWPHAGGISISRDGKIVVTSGPPGLRIWDAQSGRLLSQLAIARTTGKTAISPDGRYIVLTHLKSMSLWDWVNQRTVWAEKREQQFVHTIAFDLKRKLFYPVEWRTLRICSLESGEEIGRIPLGETDVQSAVVLENGELLLHCRNSGILRVDPTTRQVTARIDAGYSRVQVHSKEAIAQRPELAGATKIDGGSFWEVDPSGMHLLIGMRGGKDQWCKVAETSDLALSPAIPATEIGSNLRWLGDSGRLVSRKFKILNVIDPAHPEKHQPLPVTLPLNGAVSMDFDQHGRTIVLGNSGEWVCFDGDPATQDPWRERTLPDVPFTCPVQDFHPEGKRLIHSSDAGDMWSTPLTGTEKPKREFSTGEKVQQAGSFPDGTLVATTTGAYHLIKNGGLVEKLDGIASDTDQFPSGTFFLLRAMDMKSSNWTLGAVTAEGKSGELFTINRAPVLHDTLPLFLGYVVGSPTMRFQLSEISNDLKRVVLHEGEVVSFGYDARPIVESRDSLLMILPESKLARFQASTGISTTLREDLPNYVDEGHLSPEGDRLLVLRRFNDAPFIAPLSPDAPIIELSAMAGEWKDEVECLGFTRNGKGVWLSKKDGNAGLWGCHTGKAVAEVSLYEDGEAMVFLPDGRCTFSEKAKGRAFLRKLGSTELTPVESSPGVIEVLAPYLEMP